MPWQSLLQLLKHLQYMKNNLCGQYIAESGDRLLFLNIFVFLILMCNKTGGAHSAAPSESTALVLLG